MFRVCLQTCAASVVAAALAAGLALPGTARAADVTVPTPGSIQGVVGQEVEQAGQTVQNAAAAASAAQTSPTNIAVQIVISSPGASPVIVQTNGNAAEAQAQNASSTAQGGQAAQSAGGAGGAHGVKQAAQTAQGAGAQASAAQKSPANVAVQIVKDSPGASPVIVQTNGNVAEAQAGNQSSTTQQAAAIQGSGGRPGGGGSPGSGPSAAGVLPPAAPSVAAPTTAPSPPSPPPPPETSLPALDLEPMLGGLGDLNWLWELVTAGLPPPLASSLLEFRFVAWPPAGAGLDHAAGAGDARRRPAAGVPPRHGEHRPASGAGTVRTDLVLPPAPTALVQGPASSNFVQTPATMRNETSEPPPLPFPVLPAPAGGGGASASAGLLPVAVGTLALVLSFLGLLFGRLSLASARWRHQAHLAPLQRPG